MGLYGAISLEVGEPHYVGARRCHDRHNTGRSEYLVCPNAVLDVRSPTFTSADDENRA